MIKKDNKILISYYDYSNFFQSLKIATSTDYGSSWSSQIVDQHDTSGWSSGLVNNGDEVLVFYSGRAYNTVKANKSSDWGSNWLW